jgi:hypothetical protein
MSVPKSKRGKHDFKIITESNKLFVNMARWLEKDFRKANKNISIKDLGECYHFENNDLELIKVIFERYKVGTLNINYDSDMIKYFKVLLLDDVKNFRNCINKANEIFCYTGQDYFLRRHAQLKAKAEFRNLLNDISALKDIFNLHYDSYLISTVCIPMYTINKLLKAWIESDSKRFIKKLKDGSVQYIGMNEAMPNEYRDIDTSSENDTNLSDEEVAGMLNLSVEQVEMIDPKPKVNQQSNNIVPPKPVMPIQQPNSIPNQQQVVQPSIPAYQPMYESYNNYQSYINDPEVESI